MEWKDTSYSDILYEKRSILEEIEKKHMFIYEDGVRRVEFIQHESYVFMLFDKRFNLDMIHNIKHRDIVKTSVAKAENLFLSKVNTEDNIWFLCTHDNKVILLESYMDAKDLRFYNNYICFRIDERTLRFGSINNKDGKLIAMKRINGWVGNILTKFYVLNDTAVYLSYRVKNCTTTLNSTDLITGKQLWSDSKIFTLGKEILIEENLHAFDDFIPKYISIK